MENVSECYLYPSNTTKYKNNLGHDRLKKAVGLSVPAFWNWARKMPNSKRAPLLSLMQNQTAFQGIFFINSISHLKK